MRNLYANMETLTGTLTFVGLLTVLQLKFRRVWVSMEKALVDLAPVFLEFLG